MIFQELLKLLRVKKVRNSEISDEVPAYLCEVCPSCHRSSGYEIIYGYPSAGLMQLRELGLVRLGGCVTLGFEYDGREEVLEPDRYCAICKHEWQSWQPELNMEVIRYRFKSALSVSLP